MVSLWRKNDWLILASLCGCDTALILVGIVSYKGIETHLAMFLFGLSVVGVSAGYIVLCCLGSHGKDRRHVIFAVLANFLAVTFIGLMGEVLVRVKSVPASQGQSFASISLAPRDWQAASEWNRSLLRQAPSNISYFVSDNLLGWTIGLSRQSKDGLYTSSVEGIRSPSVGFQFSRVSHLPRIALVGDSFTFGLEVPYESTWGNLLERSFPLPVQVLNFGVDGYGIDQAYLRYRKDVRTWHPHVVILGFIGHDLYRTMMVYPFIGFPDWGFPFSKPRYVLHEGKIKLLNVPLPSSELLFSRTSIRELPSIDLEPAFNKEAWEHRWYHSSYLIRFLLGVFPRWTSLAGQEMDDNIVATNGEILSAFVRDVITDGASPILLYLPSRTDFEGGSPVLKQRVTAALRKRNIEVHDLTDCVTRLPLSVVFLEGKRHYSLAGNAQVAECLRPVVMDRLRRAKDAPRKEA